MKIQKLIVTIISIIISAAVLSLGIILTVRSVNIGSFSEKINAAVKSETKSDEKRDTYYLNIQVDDGGSVNCESGEYLSGKKLELKAEASEGYVFDGWYTQRGRYLTISDTYEALLDKDLSLHAKFVKLNEKITSSEVKDIFKTLYTDYSDKNSEVQEETFKKVISSNFDALDSTNVTYTKIIDVYVDKLYENIKESRQNNGENLELGNLFSESEAPAYESLMDIISGVVSEKENYKPDEETMKTSVESIIKSDVCKSVIEEIVNDEDVYKTTQGASEKIENETYTLIEDTLQDYYDTASEEEKTACKNLAELFSITLK